MPRSATDRTARHRARCRRRKTDDTETSASTTDDPTDSTTDDPTDTGPETDTGEPGNSLGVFELTYYWVTYEGDFDPTPTSDIGTCEGQPLATVPTEFADSLALEGSGKLLDGRLLNLGDCDCAGGYDCFVELDINRFPWGQGSQSNPLMPFLSIATDTSVLAFGTSVYAPDLDGQALPGGGTHDGCLIGADIGNGIDGMHIDWFVGLEDNYETLDPDVPEEIELFEGGTICP